MRTFNYSAIKEQKWDSDVLGLIAAIYKEAGKQELYLKQRPEKLEKLVEIAKESYERLFHKEPKVIGIHAGLECGLFLTKYPELDMVSFGPTLQNVHSPSERMFIPAVDRYWNQPKRIIEKVADLKD